MQKNPDLQLPPEILEIFTRLTNRFYYRIRFDRKNIIIGGGNIGNKARSVKQLLKKFKFR